MNSKLWPPKDMLHTVLKIHPAPYFSDGWRGSNWLTDVLWRVTRIDDGVMTIETLSGALGLRLSIYLRHDPRFQPEDLGQQASFKQGVLLLNGRWEIPAEGSSATYRRSHLDQHFAVY